MSSPVSEMEASSDGHPLSQEQSDSATLENFFAEEQSNSATLENLLAEEVTDSATLDNIFADSESIPYSNLGPLPSPEPPTLDFTVSATAEEQGYFMLDPWGLWNM